MESDWQLNSLEEESNHKSNCEHQSVQDTRELKLHLGIESPVNKKVLVAASPYTWIQEVLVQSNTQ